MNINKITIFFLFSLLSLPSLYGQNQTRWGGKTDTICLGYEQHFRTTYYSIGKEILGSFYAFYKNQNYKVDTVKIMEYTQFNGKGTRRNHDNSRCDSNDYYIHSKSQSFVMNGENPRTFCETKYYPSGKKWVDYYIYFKDNYIYETKISYHENGNIQKIDSLRKEGDYLVHCYYSFHENGNKKSTALLPLSYLNEIQLQGYYIHTNKVIEPIPNSTPPIQQQGYTSDTSWDVSGKPINIMHYKYDIKNHNAGRWEAGEYLGSSPAYNRFIYKDGVWFTSFSLPITCGEAGEIYPFFKEKKTATYSRFQQKSPILPRFRKEGMGLIEGDFWFYAPQGHLLVQGTINSKRKHMDIIYYNSDGSVNKIDNIRGRTITCTPNIPTYKASEEYILKRQNE